MEEKVLILDFGSQYTQLIARRIRELNIYSEIVPYNKIPVLDDSIKAVILSGSPFSVTEEKALHPNLEKIINERPVLAICYGAQYIANYFGGKVERSEKREYGKAKLNVNGTNDPFLKEVSSSSQVWMSHGDTIMALPEQFEILAGTDDIPVAAFRSKAAAFIHPVYCIQFHPEVTHSLEGKLLLKNFCIDIAGCKGTWTPAAFAEETVAALKKQIGDEKVLMALSGGVDSTVAAMLLHRAVGKNLYCFFIDNGLLRKGEYEEVLASYEGMGLNIKGIDAKQKFWSELAGVSDPEKKRKIIGRLFIEAFDEQSSAQDDFSWLGQGTI
ncbi:MAG: GMP synthase (glutamine-hydrolyzing), partial [Nonlabens sp.]